MWVTDRWKICLGLWHCIVFNLLVGGSKSNAEIQPIVLELVHVLDTQGSAGLEVFEVEGVKYLASANFWDAVDPQMRAYSHIFKVGPDPSLNMEKMQTLETFGAHGVDSWNWFVDGKDHQFLAIPNYYKCESQKRSCLSTDVFMWNLTAQKMQLSFRLPSHGAAQTDHFQIQDKCYIVVAENFASVLTVFRISMDSRLERPSAKKVLSIAVPGIAACAVALIDGHHYLIGASYHDNGWKTQSKVFLFDPIMESLSEVQAITTFGAHDAEIGTFGDATYLFFSEDRNAATPLISSKMYVWSRAKGKFVLFQDIPTDGAHAAELFEAQGKLWLAVANFGDRQGKRYEAESSVWLLADRHEGEGEGTELSSCTQNVEGMGSGARECKVPAPTSKGDTSGSTSHSIPGSRSGSAHFQLVATVTTQGATDWEYFSAGGGHYLGVSEEGDFGMGPGGVNASHVYRMLI